MKLLTGIQPSLTASAPAPQSLLISAWIFFSVTVAVRGKDNGRKQQV